ncbi:MAG: tetratricopeptide repeat protein [Candidatus Accumulibacter sp.]|nr:tetratricopeptide repeat protein [Accumulibacter sp.]
MHYPKSVAQTWQTSFDRLGGTARELLRRLAWLAPEAIPESLLDTPAAPAAPDATPVAPPRALRKALVELERYSLVHRADDAASFRVHRLVQTVSRDQQRDAARHAAGDDVPAALRAALAWLDDAFVGDALDVRAWPRLDPLAPHAQAVAGFADAAGIAEPTPRLFNDTGLLFQAKALYGAAEPLLRRALAINEASLGGEHPAVAICLNNLAGLLQGTNRLAKAEPLMRRALAIDEASLGGEHPTVAIDLNNLAALLKATNRLAEAEPLLRRALAIDEAGLGGEHPAVASDLNNLAQLLQATNRLAEAEPLMRRALAIDEASLGGEHPTVAIRLNNLAQLLQDTDRLAEAEPLLRRALRIGFVSLGGEHPHTQIFRKNAVKLLRALDRSEEEIAATLNSWLAA